jgi:hypothetical protein
MAWSISRQLLTRRSSLCWRNDEDRILFYHGINEGYAGRKPIPLTI